MMNGHQIGSSRRSNASSVRGSESGNEGGRAQWSNQAFTVGNILQQCTLPQIVKCDQQAILIKRDTPLPINLTQPLMLYQKRTIRKLLARNVSFDPSTQRYSENDETVVIPADYDGLFLRLNSRTVKDSSNHKTIESLAQTKLRAFLNLTKLTAFAVPIPQSNNYAKIDYTPGNIFVIDRVFQGSARVRTDSKLFNMKSNSIQQMRYLKCRDEKDNDIIIPLSHTGEFVEVLPSPLGNGRMSVNSDSLIATQKFPIVIRYISGKNKPRLTSFTGLFTLLDSFDESTVFGCVLDPRGFTMLELPVSSPLTFQLALNSHDLSSNPMVRKASRLCEISYTAFCRDLKFKFKFAQKITQVGGRKVGPLDENDPDIPPSATNSARFGVTTTYIYL